VLLYCCAVQNVVTIKHVDVLDAVRVSNGSQGTDGGKEYLKEAAVQAINECGQNAMVIVHHAEALKGRHSVLNLQACFIVQQ
jgi:hypothetical protein